MSTPKSVWGVLAVCRVVFANPTHDETAKTVAHSALCRVCWVYCRACAYAHGFFVGIQSGSFSHTNPEKPNKPNTLNTIQFNCMIYKAFFCVGFVLGMGFLCWVDLLLGGWW